MSKTAAIVIIGNEILSGQIEDCNSIFFTKELRELGVTVKEVAIIPDNVDAIAETMGRLSARYDYIFTSGGIGPTHDDVTIEGVAKAFGVRVVQNTQLEKIVLSRYDSESAKAALKMSDIPEGAELITDNGLAFPLIVFRNIFIFPGIPKYLKIKFDAIKERFRDRPFYSRVIHLNCHEAEIAGTLEEAEKKFRPVRIGSYPIIGEETLHVKVTIEAKEKEPVENALEFIKTNIDHEKIISLE